MKNTESDAVVITGGGGVWSATPWDYSSMRFLRFGTDGTGDLWYGYGQTIYAVIKCRWELTSAGHLKLTYMESSPYQRFSGFNPADGKRVRELEYKLTAGEVSGTESIVSRPYEFLWTLEVSEPPWPSELPLPHEVPRVFYGHRRQLPDPDDEPDPTGVSIAAKG